MFNVKTNNEMPKSYLDFDLDKKTRSFSENLKKFYKIFVLEPFGLMRGEADLSFLDALNEQEKEIIKEFLRKNINKKNQWFIETLGKLKDDKAIPYLYEILKTESQYNVQLYVSRVIWQINGDTTYFEYLEKLPEVESETTR